MSWKCDACRWGDHDNCVANGTKLCFCEECWADEDDDEEDD